MKKSLSEVLHAVDPNLRIISGKNKGRRGKKGNGRWNRIDDWEKAKGELCPRCKDETLRLTNGLCPSCANSIMMKNMRDLEKKATLRYYRKRLAEGTITLTKLRQL